MSLGSDLSLCVLLLSFSSSYTLWQTDDWSPASGFPIQSIFQGPAVLLKWGTDCVAFPANVSAGRPCRLEAKPILKAFHDTP